MSKIKFREECTYMSTIKTIEMLLLAITALIAALSAAVKFVNYMGKLNPKPVGV